MDSSLSDPPSQKSAASQPGPAVPEPKPGLSQWAITLLVILCMGIPAYFFVSYFLAWIPGSLLIGLYCVLIFALGLRRLYRVFFKAQSQLSELLATTFFAGLVMSIAARFTDTYTNSGKIIVLAVLAVSWAFGGSGWAWHAAKRLGKTDSAGRFWLLIKGWLFVGGVYGVLFAFFLPSWRTWYEISMDPGFEAYSAFVLASGALLCWPALRTELACRKRDKENAAKRASIPPAPGDKSLAPPRIGQILGIPVTWLIGPLIVKANTWIAHKPAVESKQLSDLPENVAKVFSEAALELQSEGMVPVAYLDYGKRTDKASIWAILLCNREMGIIGAVSFLDIRVQKFVIIQTIASFYSKCGEAELAITNRTDAGIFHNPPGKRAVHFPDARDFGALYRIQRAWVQREFKDAPLTLPPPGEEAAHFREIDRIALEHMASKGFLYFDRASERYRCTWKGACLMTWKSTWPWKAVLHARQRREGAQLCGGLGFPYPQ